MKKTVLITILSVFVLQSSCKKVKPQAEFTASKYNCYPPCEIYFNNTSKDAEEYEWDFGDNTTSSVPNPVHIYTNPGTYNVRLKAINNDGDDIYYQEIRIDPIPSFETVKIDRILVTGFPNSNWDISNGPDIYITISDQNNNRFYTSFETSNVTAANLPLECYPNFSFSKNIIRYIDLWDADSPDEDDYMGWVSFNPSAYSGYPETVTLNANLITVQLNLSWE